MGLPQNKIKRLFYNFGVGILGTLSSIILGIYEATLNIEFVGEENLLLARASGKSFILAIWHTFVDAAVIVFHSQNILIYSDHPRSRRYEKSLAHFFRDVGIKALRNRGFEIIDASLGKQSAGIIQFIKAIRQGSAALIAPDGPHGPVYKAKPGTAYIASKTGSLVIPVGFAFSKKIKGPNWDDFSFPMPFSRVLIYVGKAITSQDARNKEQQSQELEEILDHLCFEAISLLNKKERSNEAAP